MQSRIKSDVVVLFHRWNLMTPLHYQITLVYSISHPPLSCTFKITEIGDSGEKLFEKNENPVKFDKHCLFPFVLDDRFRDLGFRAGLWGWDRFYESFVIMMQGYDAPMLSDLIYIHSQSIWQYRPASRWSVPYLEFPTLLRQVRYWRNFTLQLNI